MTDFSDFLINNMKSNLDSEDLQILKSSAAAAAAANSANCANANLCHTIKEEDANTIKLNKQVINMNYKNQSLKQQQQQQLDYARKWAESVNTCFNNINPKKMASPSETGTVGVDYNNVVVENGEKNNDDYESSDKNLSSSAASNGATMNTTKRLKEIRCSFSKIEYNDIDLCATAAADKTLRSASTVPNDENSEIDKIKKRQNGTQKKEKHADTSVKSVKNISNHQNENINTTKAITTTTTTTTITHGKNLTDSNTQRSEACDISISNSLVSSSQKVTANPVYESHAKSNRDKIRANSVAISIKSQNKNRIEDGVGNDCSYADVFDVDNEKMYHEVSDIDLNHNIKSNSAIKKTKNNGNEKSNGGDKPIDVNAGCVAELDSVNETCNGFFKVFKAFKIGFQKKDKPNKLRRSIRKAKSNRKKKTNSYEITVDETNNHSNANELTTKVNDVKMAKSKKLEEKLKLKHEQEEKERLKKLEKENLKQLKDSNKKLKDWRKSKNKDDNSDEGAIKTNGKFSGGFDDDEDDANYKDPSQLELNSSHHRNNSSKFENNGRSSKVSTNANGVPMETLKKCQIKSREKLLFSWDKVVKKASKDPTSLKKILQEQSDKAIDNYKKMKSNSNNSGKTSPKQDSSSNSANSTTTKAKNEIDIEEFDVPISKILTAAGHQGELIRSLFSYLNQYGDDGFTIKPNINRAAALNNNGKQAKKHEETNGKCNDKKNKQQSNKSKEYNSSSSAQPQASKAAKSNLPYYLKCCLEVTPGPNSTIGSRRIIVEEGILNESDGSDCALIKTKKSTPNKEQTKNENIKEMIHTITKQALREHNSKVDKSKEFKLDEKILDKFIEELDGDGKVEVLKRKLSMYIKAKRSSESNYSDSHSTGNSAENGVEQVNLNDDRNHLHHQGESGDDDDDDGGVNNRGLNVIEKKLQNHKEQNSIHDETSEIDNNNKKNKNNKKQIYYAQESEIENEKSEPINSNEAKLFKNPETLDHLIEINFLRKFDNTNQAEIEDVNEIEEKQLASSATEGADTTATISHSNNNNDNKMKKTEIKHPTVENVKTKTDKDADIEMFYFTSESPQGKTLFKTRKIFRGFCKNLPQLPFDNVNPHPTSVDNNSNSNNAKNNQTNATKINTETRESSHHYQHQNIFKTLLKSKHHPRQRQVDENCENCKQERCTCKKSDGTKLVVQLEANNNKQKIKIEQKKEANLVKASLNGDTINGKPPIKEKLSKNRLEKLINELSTPEAIHALRTRYDINDELLEHAKHLTRRKPLNKQCLAKEKFQGHMHELTTVLNEKFGNRSNNNDDGGTSSNNGSRTATQKRKQKTVSRKKNSKTKATINTYSSKHNTAKRKVITTNTQIGTVKKKNGTNTLQKKKRSTRIGWRPVVGKQPRSSKEILKEISVIAKSDHNWINDNSSFDEEDIKEEQAAAAIE